MEEADINDRGGSAGKRPAFSHVDGSRAARAARVGGVGSAYTPRNVTNFGARIGGSAAAAPAAPRPSLLQQVKSTAAGGDDVATLDFLSRLQQATSPSNAAPAPLGSVTATPGASSSRVTASGWLQASDGHSSGKASKSEQLRWQASDESDPIPVDLSLKASLRISSDEPMPWAAGVGGADAREQARGVRRFVRGRSRAPQAVQTWQSAQYFFSFPAPGSQPPSAATANATGQSAQLRAGLVAWREERVAQWRSALRSVYMATRAGETPRFFVMGSQFRVVVLGDAGGVSDTSGRPEPGAVVTGTSRGLRAQLREHGVAFWSPLDPTVGASADVENDNALRELRMLDGNSTSGAQARALVRATGARANLPIIVRGHAAVHALYDWLLCHGPHSADALNRDDLPQLLCASAFEFGTLAKLPLRFSGVVRSQEGADRYVVELAGPILPDQLAALLSAARSVSCSVVLEAAEGTREFAIPVRERENGEDALAVGYGGGIKNGVLQSLVLEAEGAAEAHITRF